MLPARRRQVSRRWAHFVLRKGSRTTSPRRDVGGAKRQTTDNRQIALHCTSCRTLAANLTEHRLNNSAKSMLGSDFDASAGELRLCAQRCPGSDGQFRPKRQNSEVVFGGQWGGIVQATSQFVFRNLRFLGVSFRNLLHGPWGILLGTRGNARALTQAPEATRPLSVGGHWRLQEELAQRCKRRCGIGKHDVRARAPSNANKFALDFGIVSPRFTRLRASCLK